MIDYDLHIHTKFCGHAETMTPKAIIEQADRLGLKTIGITDHVYGPESLSHIEQIRNEVESITHTCRIIIGAEVDIDPNFTDGRFVTDNIDHLDYIIAGFHYIPTVGNYAYSPDECALKPERLFDTWRSTLMGIVSNPLVHTLAHPGRMIGTSIDLDVYFDDILSVYEQAAKLSASNSVCWELNELSGVRLPQPYREQWYKVYQIGLNAGVKLIYGSDAHVPESIGNSDFIDYILSKLPAEALSQPKDIGL